MKIVAALVFLVTATSALASPEHDHPPVKLSPEFEKMKALVGTWEGKSSMSGKEESIKVTYALTSGGTALVETLGPGTPMEMVTVYANSGKKVNATHYCAIGNQPQMALKKANGDQFVFEMDGMKGISSKKEMHMHGVTLTVAGNKLKQEWTNFKDGKLGETLVLEYTKK